MILAKDPHNPIAIVALLTTVTGLLFKIAAVPFHQWAPDAYEGAPTCITGFMSVAVKAAGWAMLLRVMGATYPTYPNVVLGLAAMRPIYVPLFVFVSIATMTGANFAALTQTNTKRLLAYSSIAHVGYMLLGLIAGTSTQLSPDGIKGILIYLLVYTFMNLGAFGVITSLRHRNVIGDELDDLNGLYSRAPVEAVLMLIFLLSLAGIPPLAGFWGKYFIFLSLIETGHYALASLGVLYSVFGLYYYLKMANAMFMGQSEERGLSARKLDHARRARRHRIRHAVYRNHAGPLHQLRELVVGYRPESRWRGWCTNSRLRTNADAHVSIRPHAPTLKTLAGKRTSGFRLAATANWHLSCLQLSSWDG